MDTEAKLKTLMLGGTEIAEPMRNQPAVGSVCFVVNTA